MDPIRIDEIVSAAGGELLKGDASRVVGRVFTDSREECAGAMFFAFAGERFDGHQYVEQVAAAGAAGAVVSSDIAGALPEGFALVKVADTLKAYQAVAREYRKRFSVPVLAVTGSCGKTGTKSLLYNILSHRPTVRTEANENNEIGVPKTLFRMDTATERAIVELGMRGPGEIAELAAIANPTHGIITNVEPAHIGRLGSMEAIADAKGELAEALGPDGVIFLNADNKWTYRIMDKTKAKVVTFGIESGDVRAVGIEFTLEGSRFEIETSIGRIEAALSSPGRGNVYNATAAAAVAVALGESVEDIVAGLSKPVDESGRMRQWRTESGMLLIDDTYNSSPASLRQAVELLGDVNWEGRRAAVLGDMLELGDYSRSEHYKAGKESVARSADLLVAFGEEARAIADGAEAGGMRNGSIFSFADFDELAGKASGIFRPGDMVLIKGSRGMKMERIVNLLREMK